MTSDVVIGTELRISCTRTEFADRLGIVARGLSARSAVQILSGILLRGGSGGVELAATDMELSVRTSLQASVEGDGAVVVPGRLLVELVRLLPEAEVVLEHRAEESVLHVTSVCRVPAAHVRRRGLPASAGCCDGAVAPDRDRSAPGDDRARWAS